jgi:hypothetical protein
MKGPPFFFLVGMGVGAGMFSSSFGGLESGPSSVHFPLGKSTFHAILFFLGVGEGAGGGGGCQSKEFPSSHMFLKKFQISPHFNPICFGKCSPPFTYIYRPNVGNFTLQNRTFCFGEPP